MKLKQLATTSNLELAWRRITTGGNHQYKRLFRHLYVAYEVALNDNLSDLRRRLVGGSFEPCQPERVYLPKSSGLHRPLSLLHIEDQIVLQAFANLAAKRLYPRREPLQFRVVFSNILQRNNSIFFFKRWQATYAAFQRRIRKHYANALRWVGDFDLAAFYDTVSHDLLLKTIYPRTPANGEMEWLRACLATWSSEKAASRHGHGIPQGPLASDFLAECFLLPIDQALQKMPGYTRYVDDVRLFGKTEDDVRGAIIQLERRCREHGLIPQTGKFAVKHATTVEEAMGMLPSIADPQRSSGPARAPLAKDRARSLFISSLVGRPYRVQDKTRLRYVLYRAEPDAEVLRLVCRLVPHHPEHSDAFFVYLGRFGPRKPVTKLCLDLIAKNPYAYVRGEAWLNLAGQLESSRPLDSATRRGLLRRAIAIAKKRRPENFTETLGACHFLAVAEWVEGKHYSRFLKFQPALLQAFVAPVLPDSAFAVDEVASAYLRASAFEPGISICSRIHAMALRPANFNMRPSALPSQVRNTMKALGTIAVKAGPVDPIAELIEARYAVTSAPKSWHPLLGKDYAHALGLLRQADAAFKAGMSYWLANQNSFHHAIFLALQRHLNATGHAAACTTLSKDGKLVDFGVMLDAKGPFSKACPTIADCFRAMNTRRNHLPVSHPYDKKTAKPSKHLAAQERNRFVRDLRAALPVFVGLMP
jgi:Reverse transcriptase (RNA-dependent DNA polymerase)